MSSSSDCIKREIPLKAPLARVWRELVKAGEFGGRFGAAPKVVYLVLAAQFFLQLPVTANALQTSTMLCRNGIVSIDDTIPDVVKKCGLSAYKDRREETYSFGQRHGRSYENITVDDWIYNFGPQEFMYEVTFHNGRVAKIESLDTGY